MDLEAYLKEISKYPLLSFEEEQSLAAIISTDPLAKERFIHSNLRLVVNIAKRYATDGNLFDLIQEGNLGMMRAVERFDPLKGIRFSTYATFRIKSAIFSYLKQSGIDSLPLELQTVRKRLSYAIDSHQKQFGSAPDESYLAENSPSCLGKEYTTKEISDLLSLFNSYKVISYDNSITDGSELRLLDRLGEEPLQLDDICGKSYANTVIQHIESLELEAHESVILKRKLIANDYFSEIAEDLALPTAQVKEIYRNKIRLVRTSIVRDRIS